MADTQPTSTDARPYDQRRYDAALGPARLGNQGIVFQRVIGSGGEGAAFLCAHARQPGGPPEPPFVVKLPEGLRDDPAFGIEAQLFDNPSKRHCVVPRGPVPIHLVNGSRMPALVMPFCNGGDLRHQMKERSAAGTPYTIGEAASIMAQTSIGLRESGLVHRDVKPENILLHNGEARVADWGMAVRPGDRNDQSGTAGYLAPESVRHRAAAHESQDVYAIGLIGYEMVTRRHARPFPPEVLNRRDIYRHIEMDDRIRTTRKDPLFDQILQHATAREPDLRSTHLDLLADLAHYPEARRHFNAEDRAAIAAHLLERADQRPHRSPELDRAAAAGLLELGPWPDRDQRALEALAGPGRQQSQAHIVREPATEPSRMATAYATPTSTESVQQTQDLTVTISDSARAPGAQEPSDAQPRPLPADQWPERDPFTPPTRPSRPDGNVRLDRDVSPER